MYIQDRLVEARTVNKVLTIKMLAMNISLYIYSKIHLYVYITIGYLIPKLETI